MYFTDNNLNPNPKSKNPLVSKEDFKLEEEDMRRVCEEEDRKWVFIRKKRTVGIGGERKEEMVVWLKN